MLWLNPHTAQIGNKRCNVDQKQSKSYALALLGALSADHVETVIKGNEDARYWFDNPQNWISYGGRAKNWDTVGNQQTIRGCTGSKLIEGVDYFGFVFVVIQVVLLDVEYAGNFRL